MSAEMNEQWPGRRFGAPEKGAGSVADGGRRVGAFLIDILLSAGIAWAFTAPAAPQNWSLVPWGVMTVVGVALFGQTPGHAIVGIRVATFGAPGKGKFVGLWAIPRAVLVTLIVPAAIRDSDGRSLHDRLCHTVVVCTR